MDTEPYVVRDLRRKASEESRSLVIRSTSLVQGDPTAETAIAFDIALEGLKYCLVTLMLCGQVEKSEAIEVLAGDIKKQLRLLVPSTPTDTREKLLAIFLLPPGQRQAELDKLQNEILKNHEREFGNDDANG